MLVFKCQQVVAEEGVYDTIFKHIILVRLQTQDSIKDFDEGIAVAYAGVDSRHFVCLNMVDWL